MLKRYISILLLVTMIGANFSRFFIYTSFELNKSFIIKELCENRNRPEMKCEGRCFLKKRLAAAEEREQKQEKEARSKAAVDVFVVNEPFVFSCTYSTPKKKHPMLFASELSEFNTEILHPPTTLA
ncbi:hypothetical protein [Pedobacter rhizosphaerae]|uniref:Uncharacterized protein n=1 Tax=Pedobacter rhizosphaerae TaxID=390241 RepID=A0A1H9SSS3_9SPHI|nr:hypothetical protein [Pedobacter rhizosphaerae]SER88006.1 hypothetical protein SAMN04488023_11968 [Pedobacter rhizosphaerae]